MREMMRFALMLAALLPGMAPADAPVAQEEIPVADFLAPGTFSTLKISPDGAHYAAVVPLVDRNALVIVRSDSLERTGHAMFEAGQYVTSFHWVNDRQLVYTEARQSGALAAPVASGWLYRVNVDGSENQPVTAGFPVRLQDTLRDDDDHILVAHAGTRSRRGVSRMNLLSGELEIRPLNKPVSKEEYFTDNAGQVRFVTGHIGNDLNSRTYRLDGGEDWVLVNDEKKSGAVTQIVGFSADNRTAFMRMEQDSGPDGLFAYDMASGERRLVFRDPRVDISGLLFSPKDGGLVAVQVMDGLPRVELLVADDPFARQLQAVAKGFPGAEVWPTSYTRDGKKGLYFVGSDVNSGEYYLVDHEAGEARFVTARNLRLPPERMSRMRPFRFKARDGLEIEGFVTVPRAAGGRAAPLVVIPHGGPKGIADSWGFDPEVQLLASRGYAVMKVNFRGSGNHGRQFREAGNGEWGGKMQDDLTDATRWALEQGIAAPGRICLYGASYGAYAAMMGLIREPALYACGIGNVGVYDLREVYRRFDNYRPLRQYFDAALGDRDLRAISPTFLAAGIKVPVLLGAGRSDVVTPPEQTESMVLSLKRAGVPHEAVYYEREGHGYFLSENRLDWARRVLAHLDKTIGEGRGQAPAPPAVPTASQAQ